MDEFLSKFEEAAQKVYETHERRIIPLYPWVLVKMLPKVDKVGSIFTPGNQNTVMREGYVLETWQPFWKSINKTGQEIGQVATSIKFQSELKPGDYIGFPHFEGLPVPYLNGVERDEFRLVRETNKPDPRCSVQCKFEFESPVKDQLTSAISKVRELNNGYLDIENLVSALLERFVIVSKSEKARTTSGA